MTAPANISSSQLFYDSGTANTGGTWSYTVNPGSQLVIVFVLNDLVRWVTSCTLGGTEMTYGINYNQSDMRASVYYRLNPASGAQNVSVTMSGGCRLAVVAVQMSIVGNVGNAAGNGKVGNVINVPVTTTLPDNLLFSAACCNSQNIVGYNGTVLNSGAATLRYSVGYLTAPTAGSYTVTYNLGGDPTYGAAAVVLPVAGVLGQQFKILGFPGL